MPRTARTFSRHRRESLHFHALVPPRKRTSGDPVLSGGTPNVSDILSRPVFDVDAALIAYDNGRATPRQKTQLRKAGLIHRGRGIGWSFTAAGADRARALRVATRAERR